MEPDRYRLGEPLGSGGLGRVLLAWDSALEREVAIKMLRDELPPELERRFVREARLTGRLEHPNIVPVHDFGELPGKRLFLSMKRVQGRDLGKLLKAVAEGRPDAADYSRARLLGMFQDVCLAMAFAHSKGILHRDLKPANVMIGDFGEVLVVDWGLAKEMGAVPVGEVAEPTEVVGEATVVPGAGGATMDGAVLGTPAYMPPEQAQGRVSEMDERSDVFSLGAILYEILAFRPPVVGESVAELLSQAKSGVSIPPSQRLRSAAASAPDVPPELDAICMKALATRKEDRHASALELHRDVQLFLEGVRERERRAREAQAHLENGRKAADDWRRLGGEMARQTARILELNDAIPPHGGPDVKRPLWDAETELRRMRERRIQAATLAETEFARALALDERFPEARDAACALAFDRLVEAEARRDGDAALSFRGAVLSRDPEGKWRKRLDAGGVLRVRVLARDCECLRPASGLRVSFGEVCTVPWRDGRARPDLPLEDSDWPVPTVTLQGPRWGHASSCPRREMSGVRATVARFVSRDRRFVLEDLRDLGSSPFAPVELPQGSWLVTLTADGFAPARLPVVIGRARGWEQDVNLHRAADVPDDFVTVPGGPFPFGGEWAGGLAPEEKSTLDLFVARHPVTCRDYLEFLNDFAAGGRLDEARRRQPREAGGPWWVEDQGRFRFPAPSADPRAFAWEPRWPVFGVSWLDALAFAAWRSGRDGRLYRLPHEIELEKAGRGVDGRTYPYGDEFEPSYSHTSLGLPGNARPASVDLFPFDESPYGVRNVAGCVKNWCLNAPEVPYRANCSVRGGAWSISPETLKLGARRGVYPANFLRSDGFRLVACPIAD